MLTLPGLIPGLNLRAMGCPPRQCWSAHQKRSFLVSPATMAQRSLPAGGFPTARRRSLIDRSMISATSGWSASRRGRATRWFDDEHQGAAVEERGRADGRGQVPEEAISGVG